MKTMLNCARLEPICKIDLPEHAIRQNMCPRYRNLVINNVTEGDSKSKCTPVSFQGFNSLFSTGFYSSPCCTELRERLLIGHFPLSDFISKIRPTKFEVDQYQQPHRTL